MHSSPTERYLFAPTTANSLDEIIAKLKTDHGGSATDSLHCRVLFSSDARRKSVWPKLAMDDVFSLGMADGHEGLLLVVEQNGPTMFARIPMQFLAIQ